MQRSDGTTPNAALDDTVAPDPERAQTIAQPNAPSALEATALAVGSDLASAATAHDSESGPRLPPKSLGIRSGSRIGRFVVSAELGAGGMGVVYAAYDPSLDRKVAIKMLHEGISNSHRARLEREARAMAKLSHPNVVAVHEVGIEEDRLFVAMEFVDGMTMRDWLSKENPGKAEILRVMIDAGRGLAAAHDAGMVHRDFKPDNVLVGKDGRARVSDFGLVTPLGQERDLDASGAGQENNMATGASQREPSELNALTMVGTVMGTPLYMAPEQHRGEQASHRADQFSYCVTLWEALYKNTPYSAPSYEKLVANVSSGVLQRPPKANKGAAWLRAILSRGLRVDPEERFSSMQDLLTALRRNPWRRRRRVAAGLGALSLSGAALFAITADKQALSPCLNVDAPVHALWNDDTRASTRTAFLASGSSEASALWPGVQAQLDGYSKDWASTRKQSCLSTRESRQDSEVSALALYCFERRLREFRSVLETLSSEPNEKVVRGAGRSIEDLSSVQSCGDPAYLGTRYPLPSDPAQRQELERLQDGYDQFKVLDARGEFQAALVLVDSLVEPVTKLGYAPLQALVQEARGSTQLTLGDAAAGEATLRAAALVASEAKDDLVQARIWIRLFEVLAAQARYDEALSMETIATTSAQRVPDELGLQARLHNSLGGVYIAKARYPEALASYEAALELQRRLGREGNFALAPAIANVGLAKWYAGDIPSAKQAFEEALQIMLQDYGSDHSQVAYARKNIADLELQLGNDVVAAEHYEEVVRIWKKSLGEDHVNLAYAYEQLAILAMRQGQAQEATEYSAKTMDLRVRHLGEDHPLTVQARSVAIEVALGIGTPESLANAETEIATSMAALESLGDDGRRNKSYVFDSRARLHEMRGDLLAALADRQAALKVRLEILGSDHLDVASSYVQLTRLNLALAKIASAEQSAVNAQQIFDANPGYGDQSAIAMRTSRAQIHVKRGNIESARALLGEAIAKAQACDCQVVGLKARFELSTLGIETARDSRLAEARAIYDEAVATSENAAPELKAALADPIEAMNAWLDGLPP